MKYISAIILSVFILFSLVSCSTGGQTGSGIQGTQEDLSSVQESSLQADGDSANQDTDPLPDAIKNAIINENRGKYLPGECYGVGYKIIETFEEGDMISVYALTEYVEYWFEDGIFVNISGTNPKVLMRFQRAGNNYELADYTRLDIFSGLSDEELQSLMEPLKETGKTYLFTDRDLQEVRAQADEYAAEYLRSINRAAPVGVRQEHEGQRLDDLIEDKDLLDRLFKDDELGRYPYWTGTTERLEDGVRYVYKTEFDQDSQMILYTKSEYGSEQIVESVKADVRRGTLAE